MLSSFLEKNKNLLFILPFLIYGISFFNGWHYQDDHEIAFFSVFMEDHSFLQTINLTEVGQWGVFKRFRPSYYSLRILESWLWGDHFFFWYLFRILIQIFFLKEALEWLKRYLTLNEAYFVTLILLSMVFWRDLQDRLGPGENYCVLAVAMMSLSLRLNRYKFLYLLGGLLAIGSKENFVIVPVVLSAYLIFTKQFKPLDALYLLILFAASLLVGVGIIKAVSNSGTDFYASSVTPLDRIMALLRGFFTLQIIPYIALGALWAKKKIHLSRMEMLTIGIFGFIFVSNLIFYNGKIPDQTRYDFPLMPFNIAVWVLLYLKLQPIRYKKMVVIVMSCFIVSGIQRQVSKAIRRYQETVVFTNSLKSGLKKIEGAKAVVVANHDVRSLEPVSFLQRYFRKMGLKSEFYFLPDNLQAKDAYEAGLKAEQESIAINGKPEEILKLPATFPDCVQLNFDPGVTKKVCNRVEVFF